MQQESFADLLESLAAAVAEEGAITIDVEAEPAPIQADVLEGPPVSARPIPPAAIDLIFTAEVSSKANYQTRLTHPVWPGGRSGVTIGIGYDVGTVDRQTVQLDWGNELAPAIIGRLQATCGITNEPASRLIAGLVDITVPLDPANRVFLARSVPQFVAQTEAALPNTAQLAAESLGALVSLTYNRGAPLYTKPGDRYREMRAIRDHMTARRFDLIPAELRSMKRIWEGDSTSRGLVLRREAEAVLFERGLHVG